MDDMTQDFIEALRYRFDALADQPVAVISPNGVSNTTHGELAELWMSICEAFWLLSEKLPATPDVREAIRSLDEGGSLILDLLGENWLGRG